MTIKLTDFFSHYRDLPHQRAAVGQLQELMPAALLADDAEWVETYRAAPAERAPLLHALDPLAPLLALIRSGEGGYEAINRGNAGDTPGGWKGLTSMTLGEVLEAQRHGQTYAVGAYQFIPTTLRRVKEATGLSGNVLFDAITQDYLATALIMGYRMRPHLQAYLTGANDSAIDALWDLAKEWAAVQGPEGRGVYDGDSGGNRARIPTATAYTVLAETRQRLAGRTFMSLPSPMFATRKAKPAAPATPTYFKQLDNGPVSERTCFTSAAAMLAERVKPGCLGGHANADYLTYYKLVMRHGDTTNAAAQVAALKELGITARLVTTGNQALITEQVSRWGGLALGYIHRGRIGALDPACSGHWCFCYGADSATQWIHDPYLEPDLIRGGFIAGKSGRSVRCTREGFGRRWELIRTSTGWSYAPGHGWALVVDGVSK